MATATMPSPISRKSARGRGFHGCALQETETWRLLPSALFSKAPFRRCLLRYDYSFRFKHLQK